MRSSAARAGVVARTKRVSRCRAAPHPLQIGFALFGCRHLVGFGALPHGRIITGITHLELQEGIFMFKNRFESISGAWQRIGACHVRHRRRCMSFEFHVITFFKQADVCFLALAVLRYVSVGYRGVTAGAADVIAFTSARGFIRAGITLSVMLSLLCFRALPYRKA